MQRFHSRITFLVAKDDAAPVATPPHVALHHVGRDELLRYHFASYEIKKNGGGFVVGI